jgi:hypothetical protein
MGSKKNLEAIFDLYATNVTLCDQSVSNTFVCPFCRGMFGKEALKTRPPQVIVAHCVPRSLGGQKTTLACAACDNTAGHTTDAHLKTRLETTEFLQGNSPRKRKIWFQAADWRVRAYHQITKGPAGKPRHEIVFDKNNSPPDSCEAVQRHFANGSAFRQPMRLSFGKDLIVRMDLSRVAMLRAAYLMMFRSFGYPYVFHANLNRLREQLQKPNNAIIPCRPVIEVPSDTLPDNSICLITSPERLRAFLVVLSLRTEGGSMFHHGVIMPGLGGDGDSVYERIRDNQAANDSQTFHFVRIEEGLGRLNEPEYTWYANELWDELMECQGPPSPSSHPAA